MISRPKALVVGLDGSGRAAGALSAALDLGRRIEAAVVPVHAVEPARLVGPPATWPQALLRSAGLVLAARDRLGQVYGCRLEQATGTVAAAAEPAAELLLRTAAARRADLLFLGPARRWGVPGRGDATPEVLARALCPVWVARGSHASPRRVVAAVDLSAASGLVLGWAAAICRAFDAHLTVTYVFSLDDVLRGALGHTERPEGQHLAARLRALEESALDELLERVDLRQVPWEREILEGHVPTTLLERHPRCDALVLGTHGRGRKPRALLGTVAAALLEYGEVPVVLVPPRPERG